MGAVLVRITLDSCESHWVPLVNREDGIFGVAGR